MFLADVAPLLLEVFNDSLERGLLPTTFYLASISLLHKKGKDPLDPASYRPVSLLDVDNKILAKIMAIRLENVLPTIIHEDQTGFIKNRQMAHNIRRLFDIMYSSHSRSHSEILISLDAEKALDRVEWDYLFSALSRFGFGTIFISWIKLLYASPMSSVQTNNLSDYFRFTRSTRQGCPLSPMLFALEIEPLAISLRTLTGYSGVTRGGGEHKVSLYADDLLLYISNPSKSIPVIVSALKKFGKISGYKLNMGKSILFPINNIAGQHSFDTLPFKTSTQFKYLGINVTKAFVDLYKENFSKLLDQITQDLQRWSHIAISLAGKINIIKMTVLPNFLFLFQCIPVYIKKSFFDSLDKIISEFTWNRKIPRIRKTFLQRPKSKGGMGLPNFQTYYWASNIKMMACWLQKQPQLWVSIESACCYPSSLSALLFSPLSTIRPGLFDNPVVSHTLKILS